MAGWNVYPSIEHPREEFIEKCRAATDGPWCMTEKVHGANCAYIVPDRHKDEISIASRNQVLGRGVDFHNMRSLLITPVSKKDTRKLGEALRVCADALRHDKVVPEGNVMFYGEVFGGVFPGMKAESVTCVQHGVLYTPDNNVRMFDIAGSDGKFIRYDVASRAMLAAGVPFMPIVATGTFDKMLLLASSSCTHLSTVPEMYGLESPKENEREGNVIKPVEPIVFADGERCIIKCKNARFNELVAAGVVADRKHQAKSALPTTTAAPAPVLAKKIIGAPKDYLLALVNEPRISSVCSKMHPDDVNSDNLRVIVTATKDDVLKDFAKDVDLKTIADADLASWKKLLEQECNKAVREYVERLEEEQYGDEE
eukprot:TRINITY_DN5789_c0_g1_i1.p1 TRINITY_DN5789_c0_g1~~TRINITY_DN5789_c0_g1_i1.p1  ORF type:complete len:378 (+),score=69.32 TRINITY_DN5789_c0_g1_i1:30-1136(+)